MKWGSITELLICLFFISATLLMLNEQQIHLFDQIKISQTGGQLFSDISPLQSKSVLKVFVYFGVTLVSENLVSTPC